MPSPDKQLLRFWLGDDWQTSWPTDAVRKRWFNATKADDAWMREHFGALVDDALHGGLSAWEQQPTSRLALILLLDQITRNIYRGTAQAFAGDQRALALVQSGIDLKHDQALPLAGQVFFHMPLMHAESVAAQEQGLACFNALHESAPAAQKPSLATNVRFARDHLQIIKQFGRFPHRNAALGRPSSAAEQAFLKNASRYGQ